MRGHRDMARQAPGCDRRSELELVAASRKPVELRITVEGESAPMAELVDAATNRSHPIEHRAPCDLRRRRALHIEITAGHGRS